MGKESYGIAHPESQTRKPVQYVYVLLTIRFVAQALIHECPERNGCHVPAVFSPQVSCGKIPRVGIDAAHGLVEALEILLLDIYLAAKHGADRFAESKRYVPNGAYVLRYVVTHIPVTPRYRSFEQSLAIVKHNGGTIHLLLHYERDCSSCGFLCLAYPLLQIMCVIHLFEAEHGKGMRHFREIVVQVGTDASAWAVGRCKLWKTLLEVLKLVKEGVVGPVVYFRLCILVV